MSREEMVRSALVQLSPELQDLIKQVDTAGLNGLRNEFRAFDLYRRAELQLQTEGHNSDVSQYLQQSSRTFYVRAEIQQAYRRYLRALPHLRRIEERWGKDHNALAQAFDEQTLTSATFMPKLRQLAEVMDFPTAYPLLQEVATQRRTRRDTRRGVTRDLWCPVDVIAVLGTLTQEWIGIITTRWGKTQDDLIEEINLNVTDASPEVVELLKRLATEAPFDRAYKKLVAAKQQRLGKDSDPKASAWLPADLRAAIDLLGGEEKEEDKFTTPVALPQPGQSAGKERVPLVQGIEFSRPSHENVLSSIEGAEETEEAESIALGSPGDHKFNGARKRRNDTPLHTGRREKRRFQRYASEPLLSTSRGSSPLKGGLQSPEVGRAHTNVLTRGNEYVDSSYMDESVDDSHYYMDGANDDDAYNDVNFNMGRGIQYPLETNSSFVTKGFQEEEDKDITRPLRQDEPEIPSNCKEELNGDQKGNNKVATAELVKDCNMSSQTNKVKGLEVEDSASFSKEAIDGKAVPDHDDIVADLTYSSEEEIEEDRTLKEKINQSTHTHAAARKRLVGKAWLSNFAFEIVFGFLQCPRVKYLDNPTIVEPSNIPNSKVWKLEAYDILVVPIHHKKSHHWTIAIIDLVHKSIEHYDSLKTAQAASNANNAREALVRFSKSQTMTSGSGGSWSYTEPACPQQTNTNDCGVYALVIGLCRIFGFPVPLTIDGSLWRLFFVEVVDRSLEKDLHVLSALQVSCWASISVQHDATLTDNIKWRIAEMTEAWVLLSKQHQEHSQQDQTNYQEVETLVQELVSYRSLFEFDRTDVSLVHDIVHACRRRLSQLHDEASENFKEIQKELQNVHQAAEHVEKMAGVMREKCVAVYEKELNRQVEITKQWKSQRADASKHIIAVVSLEDLMETYVELLKDHAEWANRILQDVKESLRKDEVRQSRALAETRRLLGSI